MKDVAGTLANRLERLDSHLAIVLAIHLFIEYLLDRLIQERSPAPKLILDDHRTYSFSVKLTLVFHMGIICQGLFENLRRLNRLRNLYAHEIDVDLAAKFDQGFQAQSGGPLFDDSDRVGGEISNDPAGRGVETLMQNRDATFGWLHDVTAALGAID